MELDVAWVDGEGWRGFVPLPSRQWLLDNHLVMSWVAGTDFRLKGIRDSRFNPGESLAIVPEPDNPHDPHALAVWSVDGTLQAGYVPRVIAHNLHDPKLRRVGLTLWEDLRNDERIGLGILMSREVVQVSVKEASPAAARKLGRKIAQYRRRA